MVKSTRLRSLVLLAGLLFIAACAGSANNAPDVNDGDSSGTRVKESEEPAFAPLVFDVS